MYAKAKQAKDVNRLELFDFYLPRLVSFDLRRLLLVAFFQVVNASITIERCNDFGLLKLLFGGGSQLLLWRRGNRNATCCSALHFGSAALRS